MNIECNKYVNVIVNNLAVSNIRGKAYISVKENDRNRNRIFPRALENLVTRNLITQRC